MYRAGETQAGETKKNNTLFFLSLGRDTTENCKVRSWNIDEDLNHMKRGCIYFCSVIYLHYLHCLMSYTIDWVNESNNITLLHFLVHFVKKKKERKRISKAVIPRRENGIKYWQVWNIIKGQTRWKTFYMTNSLMYAPYNITYFEQTKHLLFFINL